MSFWVGIVAAGMHLGLEMFVPEANRFLTSVGFLTAWHGMIAISLLTHARYVAHVNNEASAKVLTKRQKMFNWSLERWSDLKLFLKAEESAIVDGDVVSQKSKAVDKPRVTNVKPKQSKLVKSTKTPAKAEIAKPIQKTAPPKRPEQTASEAPNSAKSRVLGKKSQNGQRARDLNAALCSCR